MHSSVLTIAVAFYESHCLPNTFLQPGSRVKQSLHVMGAGLLAFLI